MLPLRSHAALAALLALFPAGPAAADDAHFESPPVHPLDLSPDGTRLFAVNTFDHRLSVFDLTQGPLPVRIAEIPVGIEPVTVRARNAGEVWVVNHLSDAISIVDLATLNVRKTLLVGDEPTDVVFALNGAVALVCLSQEDRILKLDALNPDLVLGSLPLPVSEPRSLALSPDGTKAYVGALESGNRTTVVPATVVQNALGLPPPDPPMNPALPPAPAVALIVRHDGAAWQDELGRSWSAFVPYTLPDNDVLEIDAATLAVTRAFQGVGTSLFNVAVHPVTGRLYVTNQEAANEVRFEPNVSGQFVKSRVTVVDPVPGTVTPRHLNDHVDYGDPAGSAAERAQSLVFPLDAAVGPDGTVYVAAFGSAKVGVLDADGVIARRIPVGDGPCGVAVGGPLGRLYVLNRMSRTVSIVDPATDLVADVDLGFDPVSFDVREGRRLFYDGANSSAHGDLACASCHLFGGMDNLAWDLGDPTGSFQPAPPGQPGSAGFHPMKGPMTTQSLRGLDTTQPFHWRGDRADLVEFNGAFVSLQGRPAPLDPMEFDRFQAFVFSMRHPPNPLRNLDGSLPDPATGPSAARGEQLFLSGNLVGSVQCADCHALPTGENGLIIPASALLESQDMETPQLRNLYEKTRFDNAAPATVRGFGYTHDGAIDDLFTFLQFPRFTFRNDNERRDVEAFLLRFDTGTHAAAGAQWTLDGTNEAAGLPRIDALVAAADLDRVGLVARGRDGAGEHRGWTYRGAGGWVSDRAGEGTTTLDALLNLAGPGTEITLTAVLEGSEERIGVDRDGDTHRDRDELDAGSDPGDPSSIPGATGVADGTPAAGGLAVRPVRNPLRAGGSEIRYALRAGGPLTIRIHDARGRLVRGLLDGSPVPGGEGSVRWDARDDGGRPVPAGLYFILAESRAGRIGTRVAVIP